MENLENKSSEGKSSSKGSSEYMPLSMYRGIELVEEGTFKGGTGVMYWM